jgi:hypothetical protein
MESNDELKKSFDVVLNENTELKTQVEALSKTSTGPKSLLSKSYSEKGSFEKSTDGAKTNAKFNLKNQADRKSLKAVVMEMSGINKGEKFDTGLVDIAQELELTGTLSKASDIQKLQAHGLELVAE